jgi:hypothetical protein
MRRTDFRHEKKGKDMREITLIVTYDLEEDDPDTAASLRDATFEALFQHVSMGVHVDIPANSGE